MTAPNVKYMIGLMSFLSIVCFMEELGDVSVSQTMSQVVAMDEATYRCVAVKPEE